MENNYLARLSRAAKWMLPPGESADVIADYRDILSDNSRTEEELRQDLGDPVEAVRMLSDKREYQRWKVVFTVLVICAVLPPLSLHSALWVILHNTYVYIHNLRVDLADTLYLAGMVLTFWFWRGNCLKRSRNQAEKKSFATKRLPKLALILLIIIPLSAAGLALWQNWLFTFFDSQSLIVESGVRPDGTFYEVHQNYLGYLLPAENAVYYARFLIHSWEALCWIAGGIALYALVKARTENARWRAFYVQGLTTTYLCTILFRFLTSLNVESAIGREWRPFVITCAVLLLIEIVGTVFCLRDGDSGC